jgi:uncharacterized protein YceK
MKKLSLLLMVVLLTGGCATVPVTGRKQLSLVSSQEINTMSASQYGEIITKGPLSTNAEQVAR